MGIFQSKIFTFDPAVLKQEHEIAFNGDIKEESGGYKAAFETRNFNYE